LAERTAALAVDAVLGVCEISRASFAAIPPLLQQADAEWSALGTLDSKLLLVLQAARLVPDSVWPALRPSGGAT
jgi:chemotaxis signal transduction protein